MVYDADIPAEWTWPMLRLRMWNDGHSMDEIDNLGFDDIGLIVGYWAGKSKGENRHQQQMSNLKAAQAKP